MSDSSSSNQLPILRRDDIAHPDQDSYWIEKDALQALIDSLWDSAYRVIGPQIDSGAIIYDELRSTTQLPEGWTEEQSAGRYQLRRREDQSWFGYNLGPHSWKKYLFPPHTVVAQASKEENGWTFNSPPLPETAFAFIGVRACELAAIKIQDRVFMEQSYTDPIYSQLRQRALIIAVNCTQAASTCFCTSMDTGPECRSDFDLALTELEDGFTLRVGSAKGAELLAQIPHRLIKPHEATTAKSARQHAADSIKKRLDTDNIHDLLLDNLDHPHWADVANRCLSCTNCTMVCPTCFCSSVNEVSDLTNTHSERVREWDSCFNLEFSYMNGGLVRNDVRSRYRQWLTHKLAGWIDQFDTSGCVGCGRCITWCPVGIDLTEEVAKLREQPQ